jgi:predicted RNase H-like HicB family nuclease
MRFVYRVEFETDSKSGQVTAKLPSLNHTADFASTAEEAVANLRDLAVGFIEVLLDEGKAVPPSDATEGGGVFLALEVREGRRRRKVILNRRART